MFSRQGGVGKATHSVASFITNSKHYFIRQWVLFRSGSNVVMVSDVREEDFDSWFAGTMSHSGDEVGS